MYAPIFWSVIGSVADDCCFVAAWLEDRVKGEVVEREARSEGPRCKASSRRRSFSEGDTEGRMVSGRPPTQLQGQQSEPQNTKLADQAQGQMLTLPAQMNR